jgi:hypothetical protein
MTEKFTSEVGMKENSMAKENSFQVTKSKLAAGSSEKEKEIGYKS